MVEAEVCTAASVVVAAVKECEVAAPVVVERVASAAKVARGHLEASEEVVKVAEALLAERARATIVQVDVWHHGRNLDARGRLIRV